MMKVKKLLAVIFAISFIAIFVLAGLYEQDDLSAMQYIFFSVASLVAFYVSGRKLGIIEK